MTTKTPDPVNVAASAMHSKWVAEGEVWPEDQSGKDTAVSDASTALKALTDAGWRIVRTEGDEYAGEDVQITEEWTP